VRTIFILVGGVFPYVSNRRILYIYYVEASQADIFSQLQAVDQVLSFARLAERQIAPILHPLQVTPLYFSPSHNLYRVETL